MKSQNVPKLLTVKETATALRVNQDTVREMVKSGHLSGFVVGKRMIRIKEADVVALTSKVGGGK